MTTTLTADELAEHLATAPLASPHGELGFGALSPPGQVFAILAAERAVRHAQGFRVRAWGQDGSGRV